MITIVHRPTARLRWLFAVAGFLAITLIAAPPALGRNSKLTCGQPTRSGTITVSVALTTDDGVWAYKNVKVEIDSSWTAETKAAFIRGRIGGAIGQDTMLVLGDTAEIQFQGKNGWNVFSVFISDDPSKEPDQISLGVPVPDQEALCSLVGTASGVGVNGQAAFVGVTVGGMVFTQQTSPGMPALVVEQMLIQQMRSAGIPARFATPADFEGGYESLPHDNQVIWFPVADTTGFREEITDTGLFLDLAAVINGAADASTVAPSEGGLGLGLEVCPSVFSGEVVSVRFSAGAGEGSSHLEVFDVTGRRVRTLLKGGRMAVGALPWDGRDEANALLPGGVYFVRLSTSQGDLVRRVVRVRD